MKTISHWVSCAACEKRLFLSKSAARRVKRMLHDPALSIYRCRNGGDGWHLGHLPLNVKAGRVARGEIYERRQ